MRSTFSLVVLCSCVAALPVHAQIRASELASMSQTIDGTKITMQYSRPRGRGRDTLFGSRKAVRWDEVWTPGANWATTFNVDKPVRLDGHPVKAGSYSVWMVVRQSGDWTMVLDPQSKRYHMNPPDSSGAQIRFPVHLVKAPYLDVLTWSMPELRSDGGTLAMQWGTSKVSVNLEVEPSLALTLPARDASEYVGTWLYTENDPTGKATVKKLVNDYENETLKGRWESGDAYYQHFALIRIAPDWFAPGIYDEHGRIYEVLRPDLTFEFSRLNGRPQTLEIREEGDHLFGSGKRAP